MGKAELPFPRRCIDCKYYPKDCNYWDEEYFKKKGLNIEGRVKPDTIHGCNDYEPKQKEE